MSCWGAAGRWNRWNARTVTSWMRTSCRPVWTVARRTWCSAPLAGTRWTMPRTIPTKSCSTTAPCRTLWPACSRPGGKAIWCTSVPGWSFRASTAAPGGKKTPRRPSMSTARPVWPGSRPSCRPCPSGPAWCARAGCSAPASAISWTTSSMPATGATASPSWTTARARPPIRWIWPCGASCWPNVRPPACGMPSTAVRPRGASWPAKPWA